MKISGDSELSLSTHEHIRLANVFQNKTLPCVRLDVMYFWDFVCRDALDRDIPSFQSPFSVSHLELPIGKCSGRSIPGMTASIQWKLGSRG